METSVNIRKETQASNVDNNIVSWKPSDDVGKRDPQISGQRFTNISFIFFNEPQRLRGAPIYGFVKVRGSHDTEKTAIDDGHRLISSVDPKYKVLVAETGAWVPLTESNFAVKDEYDVRGDKDEVHLRDKAVKQKMDDEKRKIMELKEEEEKFKNSKDLYDDQKDLNFYTLKRVTETKLLETYETQLRDLKKIEEKLNQTREICFSLDQEFPQYLTEWIDNYNSERKKIGLPDFVLSETTGYDQYRNERISKETNL